MQLTINGEGQIFDQSLTVAQLLARIGLDGRKVAVERNREIVPKSSYAITGLAEGDNIEIVHFIGGGCLESTPKVGGVTDPLEIAGQTYSSRLIIGTGKYKDYETNLAAAEAAEVDIVTVAVRRVNLDLSLIHI